MKFFLTKDPIKVPEDTDKKQNLVQCTFRQFLLSGAGILFGICSGSNFGLSSIIFEQLRDDRSLYLTSEQKGWIAASVSIGMILACFCIGWLLEQLGRRYVAVLLEIISVLACVSTYFSTSYEALLAGRLLAGIFNGMGYTTYSTFIGEVTSPKYRASCITLPTLGNAIGILLVQFMGNYFHWNAIALLFTIFPCCNMAILLYVRESYIWFINRNNMRRARETFDWFKGTSDSANNEFDKAAADITEKQSYSPLAVFTLLKKRSFVIPFAITNVSYMTSEFSGIYAVTAYTSVILGMMTTNSDYHYYVNVALNACRFLGNLISTLLIKKVSIRMVLLVSALVQGILALNLALFLYLSTIYPENAIFEMVSLVSLILVVLFFAIGLTPLATAVSGELYPASIRGIGFSLSATMNALYMTILMKVTPNMLDTVGADVTFLIFGCITLVGICVLWFILPNTKDKTLKEIENMYSAKK